MNKESTSLDQTSATRGVCCANTIIGGAPRCGTTSLFNWLADHPAATGFPVKEMRFFLDPNYPKIWNLDHLAEGPADEYSSYFGSWVRPGAKIILEGTPDYLYQERALAEIPLLPSRPKLIFIIRRPEARVYSAFKFFTNLCPLEGGSGSYADFLVAAERSVEGQEQNPILEGAIRHSRYVNYLRRWREALGPDRFWLDTLEHVMQDPRQTMKSIARYLDIDETFYDQHDFRRVNESNDVRSPRLQALKNRLALGYPWLRGSKLLRRGFQWLNGRSQSKMTADEQKLEKVLAEKFADDNATLEKEFGLDLSVWRNPRNSAGKASS